MLTRVTTAVVINSQRSAVCCPVIDVMLVTLAVHIVIRIWTFLSVQARPTIMTLLSGFLALVRVWVFTSESPVARVTDTFDVSI